MRIVSQPSLSNVDQDQQIDSILAWTFHATSVSGSMDYEIYF